MFSKIKSLLNRINPNLRKIIGNTIWLFADRVLRMGVGLIVGVWVARYLGPDRYGIFNYAIAFVSLFVWLTHLGLNRIIVRDIVRFPDNKDETLGTAFVLKLMGGILTLCVSVLIVTWIRPSEPQTHTMVAIVAIASIFQAFDTIEFWFQSQVESKYAIAAKSVAYFIVSFLKIISIQIRAPLLAFTSIWSGEKILAALGLVIVYRIRGHFIRAWTFSWERAKTLLSESWPLMISGIVIAIYMKIDIIMLGQMLNDRAVGIYAVAVKISGLWYFVPASIVESVFPSVVKAKDTSETLYYDRLQKLFNLMVAIGYPVAISMTFLSTTVVWLLFGPEYTEAGRVLSVHIWAGLFVSLGLARGPWLISEGLTKLSAATSACGAVTNVALNILLIPRYGIMGAAIATVMAQLVATFFSNTFYPKTRVVFWSQLRALTLIDIFKQLTRSQRES